MNRVRMIAAATAAATLALAGCATVGETVAEATSATYEATMLGSNEVGGGDADGYGKAEISITGAFDQVCWDLNSLRGLGTITAAHIHYGKAGVNGPPVFTLDKADEGGWKGCKSGAQWTENRIGATPSDFYVNVHTNEYPNGAIRGQLMRR